MLLCLPYALLALYALVLLALWRCRRPPLLILLRFADDCDPANWEATCRAFRGFLRRELPTACCLVEIETPTPTVQRQLGLLARRFAFLPAEWYNQDDESACRYVFRVGGDGSGRDWQEQLAGQSTRPQAVKDGQVTSEQ